VESSQGGPPSKGKSCHRTRNLGKKHTGGREVLVPLKLENSERKKRTSTTGGKTQFVPAKSFAEREEYGHDKGFGRQRNVEGVETQKCWAKKQKNERRVEFSQILGKGL